MKKCKMLCLLLCGVLLLSGHANAVSGSAAPVAENLEITTYRGVSVGGRLKARDPEGEPVAFEITTEPIKGRIDLESDGHFVYTPESGKRGKDYFGYRAVDASGNRSQEATVIIRIEKQQCRITYGDLQGHSTAYAAARLAEEGLFVGENVAGVYVFSPYTPMSREEFLVMCMKLAGSEPLESVRSTGFADDADISLWAKPYVAAALQRGMISGMTDAEGLAVFAPGRSVSVPEAAVMLNRAVNFTDAVQTWVSFGDGVPAWARDSAANISACGLLPYGCSFSDAVLTRGEAAELLSGTMDILAKR